jgi:hypothetical protein
VTDYYVGLKYLVNDNSKNYWLNRMPLIDSELLDYCDKCKCNPIAKERRIAAKTKKEVLDQLVFNVGLSVEEAEKLYDLARRFIGYEGPEGKQEADSVGLILGFGNDIEPFRFTYGTSKIHPFNAGWTTVEAQSSGIAEALLLQKHPKVNGKAPYASCYTDDDWCKTYMRNQGNFGEFEVEKIVQPSLIE